VPFEWLLTALTIALAARVLAGRERRLVWLLMAMTFCGVAVALATTSRRQVPLPSPIAQGAAGFGTSTACRSCHPAEYSSWHASYHRRMTQQAGTTTVAAPRLRQGGRLQVETTGRSVELFARGAQLWARLPDPGVTSVVTGDAYERSFRHAPIRDVRVELLTGSHQHQAFWVAGARAGELRAVPAVYLIAEDRLIPRRDAFLNPPDAREQAVRWNSNCIQCHAVAGEPQHEVASDSFASSAAELGIACEACHGAAETHARAMQNPLSRYRAQGKSEKAPLVTNPAQLPPARASEVCGRCHSYFFPKQEAQWWVHGFARSYRPGQVLGAAQLLLSPEALAEPGAPALGESAESLFYRDGTIRIGGREYNGLVRSPCFERGQGKQQLSCLSCHSMHESEPDNQLGDGKRGNGACATCHEGQAADVSRHSHHSPTSPGSLCYNCHMPHTSYALLGAVRSHRIDSPSFDERTQDRPNACNLCHLERSEAWAAQATATWYGEQAAFELKRRPELARDSTPAGAVFALAGDAAVRAIAAAALGRHESDSPQLGLRKKLLEELVRDDYAAVRHVAFRSLTSAAMGGAGELSPTLVESLKAVRDERPITIAE
jgi:predicted CXXCH cytochrome family protein